MRQVRRFWFLAVGFCTAIVAYLLTPGQWLNRLLAVALCTVLTTDQVCLPHGMTGRAVAAMPQVAVAQAESGLVAQRSSEFDDVPMTPAPSNTVTPPPYPVNPGPNFPVRRPDFDDGSVAAGVQFHRVGISSENGNNYEIGISSVNDQIFLRQLSFRSGNDNYSVQFNDSFTSVVITDGIRGTLVASRTPIGWNYQLHRIDGRNKSWNVPLIEKSNLYTNKKLNQGGLKRDCVNRIEEVTSSILKPIFSGLDEMADLFKAIFAFGLDLDPFTTETEKEKLLEEFDKKMETVKDWNEKLGKLTECEPSMNPTSDQASESPTNSHANSESQSSWLLEFSSFIQDNSGCYINGRISGIKIIQNGSQLSGTIGWLRNGQKVSEPNVTGSITESGDVRMQTGEDFQLIFRGKVQGEQPVERNGSRVMTTIINGTVEACGKTGDFYMSRQS